MDTEQTCPACRRRVPANAPEGLCPECLVRGGLPSGMEIGDATTARGSGDGPFVPPTVEEIAGFFPQLEVLEFIGQGGMGAVYKARQKQLDRVVALKILPPGIGDDPAFAERFAREAQAMAKLSHPGIVTIHDFGQTDGLFYFLMEFVDGVTLGELQNRGQVSPREALAIVPQICEALQYAHDAGIVHRDIKPENILLDRSGRVKVADFGLAKLVGMGTEPGTQRGKADDAPAQTEAGRVMGTPQYMAPEQRERPQEVDRRADIYSLGVVFYQLLTGELPSRPIEPPSKRVQIDVRLDEIVLRALEQEPRRRYQQVSEFQTQVESVATTSAEDRLPQGMDDDAMEESRWQVRWPAIGLLVTGMLNCPGIPMMVLYWGFGIAPQTETYVAPSGFDLLLRLTGISAAVLLSLSPGVFTIFAAVKMIRLEAYGLALAASILAIVTSPSNCLIGLPMGIWAMVVLSQPDVRAAFRQKLERKPGGASVAASAAQKTRAVTSALIGLVFLLAPAAFIWFLLAGHWTLGVDLDAGEQFLTGLLGLPLSVGVGAVAAWMIEKFRCSFGLASDEIAPTKQQRWSGHAICSLIFLIISLPLGGGTIVVLQLAARDSQGWRGWHPGTEELVVTLSLFGGALLMLPAATLWGITAVRQIRAASRPMRGRSAGLAAAWFWPCMLAATAASLYLGDAAFRQQFVRADERITQLQGAEPEALLPQYERPPAWNANPAGELKLKNPGMEEGDRLPLGWEKGSAVAGVEYVWDKGVGHQSQASLCLHKTVQKFFPIAEWRQTVAREGPSPAIQVRVQVKAEEVSKAMLDVVFLDEDGEWISHEWVSYIGSKYDDDEPANHDWTEYSGRVNIPAGTKEIQIAMQIYGPGKIWFDDLLAEYLP